ncbi:Ku protein [Fictibacillus barbaricus]|uniref:Non-homologous end joining protein Ku n=1 Tax=Fictibacillus barbaricus TaxID=182136 RepID=A0ABS2ZHQ1_9BACL|nr:Ku protein [Fictibacillus barbaricus]MBN3546139.1 Ku protein [Fictibacillus barbaricus]GGB58982.1 non-homologous end joining protein Ku [Fictibacillus barbaricus]
MHTMWKGAISFGLVNIPIKLFAATENKDIKMRYLHEKCHSPVQYEKICPVCEETVDTKEIVKGYEYEPGKFVVVEKEELDELAGASDKSIEIIDFIQLEEIDPIFYNRSYFIGPGENGTKSFALLKKAMEDTGKIGLAKFTLRSKEHLAAVRVYKNGLVLETIFYPDEVRNVEHVPGLTDEVSLNEKELEMAKQLIEQLTAPFEPERYEDEYREAVLELINSKISGNEVKVAKEKPKTNVVDLMEALQASINESKGKGASAKKEKNQKNLPLKKARKKRKQKRKNQRLKRKLVHDSVISKTDAPYSIRRIAAWGELAI